MLFSCYKVARIIAFVQCLQADIAPFIIHAENKEEYEGRLDSPARLEQLFRVSAFPGVMTMAPSQKVNMISFCATASL